MFDNGLLIAIFLAIVGQSTVLWRKLGSMEAGLLSVQRDINHVQEEQAKVAVALEETNRKSCPFPDCPVFKRAIEEAAPKRDILEQEQP